MHDILFDPSLDEAMSIVAPGFHAPSVVPEQTMLPFWRPQTFSVASARRRPAGCSWRLCAGINKSNSRAIRLKSRNSAVGGIYAKPSKICTNDPAIDARAWAPQGRHGVDDPTAVVDHDIAQDADAAGVGSTSTSTAWQPMP